ncbi:hypothetical protein EVB91_154 [Rhizobium phage RHph_I1_18]|nr:hypothetical protein EVB91_154 [Rhizobium phage RHph_I1_18]
MNEQQLKEEFLAFCKSKPADERYSYVSTSGCAFAQFLKHNHPRNHVNVGPNWYFLGTSHVPRHLPVAIADAVAGPFHEGFPGSYTFGQVVERLESGFTR